MGSRKIKIKQEVPDPDMNPVVLLERLPEELVNDIMGRTQKVEIKSEKESESPMQVTHPRNKRSRESVHYFKNDEEESVKEESEDEESDDSVENRFPNKRPLRDKPDKKKRKLKEEDSDDEFERMLRQPGSSDDEFDDFQVWAKKSGRKKAWIDTIKTLPTSKFVRGCSDASTCVVDLGFEI